MKIETGIKFAQLFGSERASIEASGYIDDMESAKKYTRIELVICIVILLIKFVIF